MAYSSSSLDPATSCERCLLAHALNNTLAVIIGECQLAEECTEPECANRIHRILGAARLMADRINNHRCQIIHPSPVPGHASHL